MALVMLLRCDTYSLRARTAFNCEEPLINEHITIECSYDIYHLKLGFVEMNLVEKNHMTTD